MTNDDYFNDIPDKKPTPPGNEGIQADTLEQLFLGGLNVGAKNIRIDGPNRRILVYDEDGVPVGLWGYHENGF